MTNVIATAKVTLNHTRHEVESISDFTSSSTDYYQTRPLKQALKNDLKDCINSKIDELLNIFKGHECFVQVFENKEVRLISSLDDLGSEDLTKSFKQLFGNNINTVTLTDLSENIKAAIETAIDNTTANKIKNHCKKIFDNETKSILKKEYPEISAVSEIKKTAKKTVSLAKKGSFFKLIDELFVKRIVQAKGTDLAILSLFVFIILATAITIFAPHSSFLHLVNLGSEYSHPVFGVLNITVGLGIAAQSIKNIKKAIENRNKEELILAIVSLLFSFALIATGATAAANFSNDYLLKSLFAVCAGFSFLVGIYNLIQTQRFRKKLNDSNLKDFLKNQIEISEEEYKALKAKIDALSLDETKKELKKNLSKEEFAKITNDKKGFLEELLLNTELQVLQKRKLAKLEKILRSKLAQKAIAFLKSTDQTNEEALKKEIYKELNRRAISDVFRISATAISLGAFGFTNLQLNNENLQNLIYYSMLLTSKLSGFWLNYIPSWRNVPASNENEEEKPKSIYEHMKKRARLDPQIAF